MPPLRIGLSASAAPLVAAVSCASTAAAQTVFINEMHYDNAGRDEGEAVEIAGPTGTDLTGWSLVLYNGNGGALYDSVDLDGILPTSCEHLGVLAVDTPGLQNGSPDGVALLDGTGNLVQFLSYEGTFTAANGPAAGATSVDIGVSEGSSTQVGDSLQLASSGWCPAAPNTFGECNADQVTEPGGHEPPRLFIHEIQGSGPTVTLPGATVTVEAIVVGDFQAQTQLGGFFLQEEDADIDADSQTSEGIFVFCGSCPVDVSVGDQVEVTGSAYDFFGMSQLSATTASAVRVVSHTQPLPTPATVDLPFDTTLRSPDAFYEPLEGMLVRFTDELTVDESYQLGRFGQLLLSEGGRLRQFTDGSEPSAAGLQEHQRDLAARRIILDDDNNTGNNALANGGPVFHPQPGLSASHFLRGGDTIEGLTGVLHWSWAGWSGTDAWRLRPVTEVFSYEFERVNQRQREPQDVGGSLTVASLNVLNYFTTLDLGSAGCGPAGDLDCRGAHSPVELQRQTDKLVSALCAIDASIVGLIELENNATESLEGIVRALAAAGCNEYRFINTGVIGSDAIKVGVIYEPGMVAPVGLTAILDDLSFTDPAKTGEPKNRPAMAQTFVELSSGEQLTVVVNHLKSKGSPCGPGDDAPDTGVGSCNLTRTLAAEAEAEWLATDPTGTGSKNILILGDLNAYRMEDPIDALVAAGYTDLITRLGGDDAYTYLFDGQLGSLDYALASAALLPKVTGATAWHINADEVPLLDYNDTVRDAGERPFEAKPTALPLFDSGPYRSSDHDPVIVGLQLAPPVPHCRERRATIYVREGRIVGGPVDGHRYFGVLVGSSGEDVIVGTDRGELILALSGNDIVCSGNGHDTVFAWSGRDAVEGEAGNDWLFGGTGSDELCGGPGNDLLHGGRGQDTCTSGVSIGCE
jgi:predicted extracellular nuclease